MDATLTAALEKLELDAELLGVVEKVFNSCQSAISDSCSGGQSAEEEDARRLWYASILFIAKNLKGDSAGGHGETPNVTLTQILKAFGISVADFLKELPVICKRAEPNLSQLVGPDNSLERQLKLSELQISFVYTTVLAKKCRDLFQSYFNLPIGGVYSEPSVFHLTWQLFIVAKAKLFPPFPDLVASFNLLICVLAFVFSHVSSEERAVDLADKTKLPVHNLEGAVDVLESFATASKANLKEVKPLMGRVDTLLRSLLADFAGDDAECAQPPEADKIATSWKYFPGLLDGGPDSIGEALSELNRSYEQVYSKAIEIDERPFIDAKPVAVAVRGTPTPPSMTKCQVGTPIKPRSLGSYAASTPVRLLPSPLRPVGQHMLQTPSPVRLGPSSFFATPGMFPGTPVTEAMAAASWLQDLATRSPSELTPDLKRFLETAGPDVEASVASRVAQLANAVFPPTPDQEAVTLEVLKGEEVSPRGAEGVKVYYRVLESMLKAEQDRTGRSNFASLLASVSFHKCLAACSFEVVIASYRMVTHAFPMVLEKLELPAFDMSKLVGTFVRHISPTEQVPRELKRHLFSIEEKILEQQAWERGSSLYPMLIAACSPPRPAAASPQLPDAVMDESPPVSSRRGASTQTTPTKRSRQESGQTAGTPTKVPKPADSESGPAGTAAAKASGSSPTKASLPVEAAEPCSPSRPGVPAEVAEAAAALVSAASGGLHSPSAADRKGLLSPRRKSDTSAFSAFMSPLRRHQPGAEPAAAGAGGGQRVVPAAFGKLYDGAERPGRAVVSDFLNKVLKLAALRIADICDRLDFEPLEREQIVLQVYTMVSHVISEHTSLLYGRHLDQIMLCALYGVCKVNQLKQITFKDIITQYKKQAQAKNSIFRTVAIQLTPGLQVVKTGDVIEFYNAVFIPATKAFLLQLGNKTARLTPLPTLSVPGTPLRMGPPLQQRCYSTPPATERGKFALKGASPPSRLGTPGKVFVSPMRQSPQQVYPRASSLFSARMGESSTAYSSPSKDITFINGRLAARYPFRPASLDGTSGVVLQSLDPNSAVGNAAQAAVALPLCSGGGNGPSSERSTGSHASEPPSASLGSQLSSEPSGSPAAGGCGSGASGRGCALDHGLLNLAAAAEQGRMANGASTDSEESGGTTRNRHAPSTVAAGVGGTEVS